MRDDGEQDPKAHGHGHTHVTVQADPATSLGVYANLMMVSHRKGEFVLDFVFVPPQPAAAGQAGATLRARVITTPEHVKRIVHALQENVQRYEAAFGTVTDAADPARHVH